MCFNPFACSGWPFFGSASEPRKRKLQDLAEDISFEDVKESANKKPQIDESARAKQLAKAVEDVCKDLFEKSPMVGLLAASCFLNGAKWTDEHPASNYGSSSEWMSAMREELNRLLKAIRDPSAGHEDVLLEMALSSLFIKGASWADDNPAPTL